MNRIVPVIIVGAALSLGGASLRAEDASAFADDVGLPDYLRYAALNNAGLRASFERWKAALERVPQADALPDPRFSYVYFIEEVETRVGPQRQRFGLAQTFPWIGTLRLREGAAAAEAAAQQAYEKAKLSLFYRVEAAYYEYWYLWQALAVTKEHIRLVANLEGVARMRFKAGAAPHSAVIQAQVELGKLDDRVRTLEALQRPTVAKLNAALNRPVHLSLPWPDVLPALSGAFSDEHVLQRFSDSNPDLRRLAQLVLKEDAGIRLARKNYYPDITLGVDYVDTGAAQNPDLADSGKDPIMAMASISLPLWYGKRRAAEREARHRKAAAEASRDDAGKRLEADLVLALYHFRDAERKIALYGDTLVSKAEQSLKVTKQGFEAGSTEFVSLIDAQRLLLEFQLAHRRAQADRGKWFAAIDALVGGDVERLASDDGDQASGAEQEEGEEQ